MNDLPGRFWLEAGLAAVSTVLLLVTLLWGDWMEIVLRVDPDQGSGSLEWLIVAVGLSPRSSAQFWPGSSGDELRSRCSRQRTFGGSYLRAGA